MRKSRLSFAIAICLIANLLETEGFIFQKMKAAALSRGRNLGVQSIRKSGKSVSPNQAVIQQKLKTNLWDINKRKKSAKKQLRNTERDANSIIRRNKVSQSLLQRNMKDVTRKQKELNKEHRRVLKGLKLGSMNTQDLNQNSLRKQSVRAQMRRQSVDAQKRRQYYNNMKNTQNREMMSLKDQYKAASSAKKEARYRKMKGRQSLSKTMRDLKEEKLRERQQAKNMLREDRRLQEASVQDARVLLDGLIGDGMIKLPNGRKGRRRRNVY